MEVNLLMNLSWWHLSILGQGSKTLKNCECGVQFINGPELVVCFYLASNKIASFSN
jgi:hypothetical protein